MNRISAFGKTLAVRLFVVAVFVFCSSLVQAGSVSGEDGTAFGVAIDSGETSHWIEAETGGAENFPVLKGLRAATPTVSTTAISSLAGTSATSGGNVTADGGSGVTARGVCWATTSNPTTANSKTSDGTGTGVFTSSITGLSPGTTYHVRAYATNGAGTAYGSDVEFTTLLVLDASTGSTTYITGGSAVVVDSALTLSATSVTGFRVLIQTNFQTGDVLGFDNGSLPGGVNGSYNSGTSTLTFTGTASAADWQTLLRTVNFSTSSSNTSTRTVTFSAGGASPLADNGHFYEFVTSAAITWPNANTAANNRKLFGLQGYLATVTSAAENSFVVSKLAGQGWIGASDAAVESVWRWVTGPEGTEDSGNGRRFFTQTSASAGSGNLVGVYGGNTPGGGVAFGGQYINWSTSEPNDSPSEDYAHYLDSGYWNDYAFNNGSIAGYVVEYGGMTGDPAQQLYDSKSVLVSPDSDGDGTADVHDECPTNASMTAPGPCGCGTCAPTDVDGDGSPDFQDNCPHDASKDQPGLCGCGVPDTDSDSDGTPDCNDQCPNDPSKTEPGDSGCSAVEVDDETDADGDGNPDSDDGCPDDPAKSEPGLCGCGVVDDSTDGDGDGTPDCTDRCPNDPSKTQPGNLGCGIVEADSDGDGVIDELDACPNDPDKIDPGIAGCGNEEVDSDGDGVPDSTDECPSDPNKTSPGNLGCNVAEAPDLEIVIEVEVEGLEQSGDGGQLTVEVGSEIQTHITVRNRGTGGATNVRVAVPLPANTEFVSADFELVDSELATLARMQPAEASVEGDTIYLFVGDVPVGKEVSVEMTLRAIETGDVIIDPEAGSNETSDPVPVSEPGQVLVNQDSAEGDDGGDDDADADEYDAEYTQIITTTTPTPCGAAGVFSLLSLVCTMLSLRCRGRSVGRPS